MLKVIIVDDRQTGIEFVRNILSKETDINIVSEAKDIATAREDILYHHPDLVFMDIKFDDTESNGIDLVADLERKKKLSFTVVFMTAYNQEFVSEYLQKIGVVFASKYLQKPLNPKEVLAIVNDVRELLKKRTASIQSPLHNSIKLQDGNTMYYVDFSDIFYVTLVTGVKNLIEIHLISKNKEIIIQDSLTGFFERELPKELFYKANKDTVINKSYLDKVSSKSGNYSCTICYDRNNSHTFRISQQAYTAIRQILL